MNGLRLFLIVGLLLAFGCSGSVEPEGGDGDGGGTGDGDGDGTGGGSLQDLPSWEEIEQSIEALNSCSHVMDCKAIGTRPCESRYLNAGADTTELEADIQARLSEDYPDHLGCDASCECGFLLCSPEGKCVTESSQCEEPPDDSKVFICL